MARNNVVSLDNLIRIKEILQFNRQIKHKIQILTNEFINIESDFMQELQHLPKTDLEDDNTFCSNNFQFLDKYSTSKKVQLALCGPNSSGKTSFLHIFLKIGNILPSKAGPVTARIVKLTYSSSTSACLNVYSSIQAGLSEEQAKEHVDLAEFFEEENKPNWAAIRNAIAIHVERPTNLSEDDFNNWTKHFVEIRIPSPILELGIDVYDTPGFLFHDRPAVKQNLHDLVELIKPILVFMYENSSIAGDAHECFLAIKAALGNLEHPHIFFLNTKQDISVLFHDAGINSSQTHLFNVEKFNEIFPKELKKRFRLLTNIPAMANDIHWENTTNDVCDNFDICCTPRPRSLLPECATQMIELSISHIIQFAVKTNLEQFYHIINSILELIDNFFQFSLSTSYRDPKQWLQIRDDAQTWGETFFRKFQPQMDILIKKIHSNILRHFDEHFIDISERATKLNRCSDPLENKTRQIIKQNIKEFIKIAIQEEVIEVAVNEIINQAKETFQQTITHQLNINPDRNELLLAAQRQVLIDISAIELTQRSWLKNILFNISTIPTAVSRLVRAIRTQCDIEHWNNKKFNEFKTEEKYYAYNEALDFCEDLTDPEKRKDFSEAYLNKMKLKLEQHDKLFERNLKEWIENRQKTFFQNIKSNYQLAIKNLSTRKIAYQITNLYSGQFARIQCQLLSIKYLQNLNGQFPMIDTTITLDQGAFFIVHPAQWGDNKNLVVKKLKQPLLDYSNLQYLEAHYHRKITELAIPNIVPLLYLFTNPSNENDLWIFLPRYKQSLNEYLEKNIQIIKSDQIIKIALDIANAIVKLHSNDIVHRDIKSKNILLDDNDQCYLADFGTCKQTTINNIIIGTYPLPPELLSPQMIFSIRHDPILNYDGIAVDIYSFGILLYELLPKSQYYRPHSNGNDLNLNELFTKTLICDILNNNDYQLLIKSCLSEQRPTAREIVQKLEEFKRYLEEKLCNICETNRRKCRCYPCGHKLLCEQCYNQLSTNTQGKKQCILCRRIIDQWQEDNQDQTFYLNT